jgi:hypothetical protein
MTIQYQAFQSLFTQLAELNWLDLLRLWPFPLVILAVITILIESRREMRKFKLCRTKMERLRFRVRWYKRGINFHYKALLGASVVTAALWLQEAILFDTGPWLLQILQPFGFLFLGAIVTLEILTNAKLWSRRPGTSRIVVWFFEHPPALYVASLLGAAIFMGAMALAMQLWGPAASNMELLNAFGKVAAATVACAPLFLWLTLRTEAKIFTDR